MVMAIAARRGTVLCGLAPSRSPHPVLCQGGLHGFRAPVRLRLGCGAAHVAHARRSPSITEPERVSHQPQRAQGAWPMCAGAVTDTARPSLPSTLPRLPPGTSSEASGAPAPRTTAGEPWAARRPVGVFPGHRRHAPASGLGASTLGPGRVVSPGRSGPWGLQHCPGDRAQPLPRRPPGETHGRSWSLRSRRVCPPRLWHT